MEKTKLNETVSNTAPMGFAVFTGTSANKAAIAVRKLEYIYDLLSPEDKLKILGLDAEGVVPVFPVPMPETDMDSMTLGPNEFVPLPLPDAESLEKAERTGKLGTMAPSWYKKPGVSKDNLGTGGSPRNGRGLISLNINRVRKKIRRNLRDCGDYGWQRQLMDQPKGKKAANGAITVVLCPSLLGGFGTGTLITLLRIIREEAETLKLPVKIVVLAMVMGSIEPVDREIAARNESSLLRELNAILVGQYRSADQDDQSYQPPCDSVVLISNANKYGEFKDLGKLIALAAQYIFYLFHTTLGQAIQEKAVDIEESRPKDDLGGRRWGSTMSISKIHLDLGRAIRCVAYMLVTMFLKDLLAGKEQPEAVKEADLATSELALAETATKSLACPRLYRLSDYGNADARERASTSFAQRSGNQRGLSHCCDLEEVSAYTLNIEMQQRLVPQMHREAGRFGAAAKRAIGNKVLMMLTQRDGLPRATQFLKALAEHIAGFVKANHKKLEVAQAKKKSIDDALGHARDMLNRLKARFWLWRFLSFSTKREIARVFLIYTESAIRNNMEIAARLLLANEVYSAIQGFIEDQATQVNQIVAQITVGQKDVDSETNRLRTLEPILTVPLGSELVTEAFIDQQFGKVLTEEDGPESVSERIFAEFSGQYKNLIAFNHCSWEQIQETLLDHCTSTAHRHLCTLNVADVFRRSCTSMDEQKERIAQCVRESSGRLRLVGEADEIIPTIKFIGVNDRSTGEWVADMANEIDTTSGDWQIIEIKDSNTIVFFQQRCRVSLVRLIAHADTFWQRPDDPQERVKLGSDPILALIPSPDCCEEDVCTVVAMGLVSGTLRRSEKGYELDGQSGDPISLGTELGEIICGLKDCYDRLVGLYESSVRSLVRNYGEVEQRLSDYIRNGVVNDGSLAAQLGKEPFVRAQETVDALMPYLRRMPLSRGSSAGKHHEPPGSVGS